MAAELSLELADAAATEALGEALGRALPPGSLVALEGDLGAGKTTLVRGLARGLGIDEPVTSPTFTLHQRYEGARTLEHLDAFMEGRERGLLADGGVELLAEADVAAVEWAERVEDHLPRPNLLCRLRHRAPAGRRAVLSVRGEGPGAEVLAGLLAALTLPPGVRRTAPTPPEDVPGRPAGG